MEPSSQLQYGFRHADFICGGDSDSSIPQGSRSLMKASGLIDPNADIFQNMRDVREYIRSDDDYSNAESEFVEPSKQQAIYNDIAMQHGFSDQPYDFSDQPYYTPLTNCEMEYEGAEQELLEELYESDGDIGGSENSFQEAEITEEAHYGLEGTLRTPSPPKRPVDESEKPTTNFGAAPDIASRSSGNWEPNMCYGRKIKEEKNDCEDEQETDSSVAGVSKIGNSVKVEDSPRSRNRGTKRRAYNITPDAEKNTEEYRKKRERNNDSVKQSREKKKRMQEENEAERMRLKTENAALKKKNIELLESNEKTVKEYKRLRIKYERLEGLLKVRRGY